MSQKEKEMKQGAAEAENENLKAEHAEAENGETSAGSESQEAETKETEKESKECGNTYIFRLQAVWAA